MPSYFFRQAITVAIFFLWIVNPTFSEEVVKPTKKSKTRVATYSLKRVLDQDVQAAIKEVSLGKGAGTREEWLEVLQDSSSFEIQVFDAVILEDGEPSGRIKEFVGDDSPDIKLVVRKNGATPKGAKNTPPDMLRTKEFEVKIQGGVVNHRDSNKKIVSKEFVVGINWEAKDGKGLSLGDGVTGTGYGFQSVLQIGEIPKKK